MPQSYQQGDTDRDAGGVPEAAGVEGADTPEFLGISEEPAEQPLQRGRSRSSVVTALLFLAPNILGFLAFTTIPLIFSLIFAFTNWDLTQHNDFRDDKPEFVGLKNFFALFEGPEFMQYFGNTLFFMIGIPFGIAAALASALLLSRELKAPESRGPLLGLAFLVVGVAVAISLAAWFAGGGGLGMVALFVCLTAVVLFGGILGGQSVYRTLFYIPHFVGGVATYILWGKLFNPQQGPLTLATAPVLGVIETITDHTPSPIIWGLAFLFIAGAVGLLTLGMARLRKTFNEGDLGSVATFLPFVILLIPAVVAVRWFGVFDATSDAAAGTARQIAGAFIVIVGLILGAWTIFRFLFGQELRSRPMEGFGSAVVIAIGLMVAQFVLIGLASSLIGLPSAAASETGLVPPQWLQNRYWVKPSLMFIGFWGAVGSNTMLLYLAALTNVPGELYEAADIDGATPMQRFWSVTWPQLAPTTFFIVVMGVIGGLQGGFEMVRTS